MKDEGTQGKTSDQNTQSWKKFVTLNPPNAVILKENRDDGKG